MTDQELGLSSAGRLAHAVQELSLADSVEDIQRVVRSAARELVHADGATVVLRDGEFCYYADEDAISPLWKGQRFPLDACVSGWAMTHRETVVIPDIYADERVPQDAYRPTFVHSMVMVPIRSIDPLGAIGTYWAVNRTPSREEITLLRALADSTAVAFASVALSDQLANDALTDSEARLQAVTDELTGLPNRRGFRLLAEPLLESTTRNGRTAVMLFIDLDGLKHTNDTRGHSAGDLLLQEMATALRQAFRGEDLLARLGGDEFVVLTAGDSVDSGELGRRLRRAMFEVGGGRPRGHPLGGTELRASVGAARFHRDWSLDMLLAEADAAMYREKRRKASPRPRTGSDALATPVS